MLLTKGYGYVTFTVDGDRKINYTEEPVPESVAMGSDNLPLSLFSLIPGEDTYAIGPYRLRNHGTSDTGTSGLPVDWYVSEEVWHLDQLCQFTNSIFFYFQNVFALLGIVVTPPGVSYGRNIYHNIPLPNYDGATTSTGATKGSERGLGAVLEIFRGLGVVVGGRLNLQLSVMTQKNPPPAYNPEFSQRLVPWLLLIITVEDLPTHWRDKLRSLLLYRFVGFWVLLLGGIACLVTAYRKFQMPQRRRRGGWGRN